MPKVTKEQQAKMDEAIHHCETSFKKFFTRLEEHYDKKTSHEIAQFILENCYFAGGIFRSYFTDTPVNDIDVFFSSQEAVIEFKNRFLQPNNVFDAVTSNDTFIFRVNKNNKSEPYLSFVTRRWGLPKELIWGFDFSFNQHYYSLFDGSFEFDMDTFSKKGRVNNAKNSPINTMYRVFRFLKEGFQIPQNDMLAVIEAVANIEGPLSREEITQQVTNATTGLGGLKNNLNDVPLSGEVLTDVMLLDPVIEKKVKPAGIGREGVYGQRVGRGTNTTWTTTPPPTITNIT